MQLTRRRARSRALAAAGCGAGRPIGVLLALLIGMAAGDRVARADATLGLGTSYFRESGGPLHMNVLIPSAEFSVDLAEPVALTAGWTADVVSGASVAVVDAPAADVDAISSASVTDTRHEFAGTLTLRDGNASVDLGYSYGFESDYRSNAFSVAARAELFDKNSILSIAYGRGFDEVCDLAGSFEPVMKPRLDASKGCFEDADTRSERELAIHTWQAAWSQNWTSTLTMQLTASAQLLHGFQSNPYRAIRIGKTAAQEYHPKDRARYALSLGVRYFIVPLAGALQAEARVYRDTWDIGSLSAELAYEQSLLGALRVRARGRYYTQGAAAFYSDDYVLAPRGRYFTGDRELSSMRSALLGGQLVWAALPRDDGTVLGFLSGFELTAKGDVLKTFFEDFHYDRAEVPNTLALVLSLEARATF